MMLISFTGMTAAEFCYEKNLCKILERRIQELKQHLIY